MWRSRNDDGTKPAIGNSATVAMGGAAAANAMGTSGTLINPSAPAAQLTAIGTPTATVPAAQDEQPPVDPARV